MNFADASLGSGDVTLSGADRFRPLLFPTRLPKAHVVALNQNKAARKIVHFIHEQEVKSFSSPKAGQQATKAHQDLLIN